MLLPPPLPLDPIPHNAIQHPHQLPVSDSTNNVDVQSMAPPPKVRKRKASTLRLDDWEPVKARVMELHVTQNIPLPEVKQTVEEEFPGFIAT
jgi:hypothetical protein